MPVRGHSWNYWKKKLMDEQGYDEETANKVIGSWEKKGESNASEGRKLNARQKKLIDKWVRSMSSPPMFIQAEDLPYELYKEIESINDYETLYQDIGRYASDIGNKIAMQGTNPHMHSSNYGSFESYADEGKYTVYIKNLKTGEKEKYGTAKNMKDVIRLQDMIYDMKANSIDPIESVVESYATEDDYKHDFDELTSLAQDKIEDEGVSQSEWDNTPEEEREELEKEIRDGEAYNPSDLVCPECGDITKDDKEFDDHLSAHRFNESYSKESFDFHSDAGHGWLEVPESLLKELGIAKQISRLSYQKGNKVYIEEDGDYMTFKKAYEEKYGSLPINELPQKDDYSPIRDYQPYGGY